MRLGSLFSGAGLGDLGWMMSGFDISWQVEIDEYCQKILELRFPESKKYHDIKKLKGKELEPVDIVAGGFPCQPFSVAGKQGGDQDDRNLWPEMLRVIKEVRPTWVVGENVSGIINIYLDTVLNDLESEGYSCRTFVFPAHAFGAWHRRERIWIVAESSSKRRDNGGDNRQGRHVLHNKDGNAEESESERIRRKCGSSKIGEVIGDSKCSSRIRGNDRSVLSQDNGIEGEGRNKKVGGSNRKLLEVGTNGYTVFDQYWKSFTPIGGVDDGCSSTLDRLKALGNGQVVACSAFIGQQIMEFERINNS